MSDLPDVDFGETPDDEGSMTLLGIMLVVLVFAIGFLAGFVIGAA